MTTLTLRSVVTHHGRTVFGEAGFALLGKLLREQERRGHATFLLADRNTNDLCLPFLSDHVQELINDQILVTEPGEGSKTMQNAGMLCGELALAGADRHSLLLNLGGGVVTDLGGFVAATFKRGIRFINIPTTLTGMADAAIGGKTGVNLDNLKNQIGTFTLPELTVIHPLFLNTLAPGHLRSGFSEVVKCALVADGRFWRWLNTQDPAALLSAPAEDPRWLRMIRTAAAVKHRVVSHDFTERGERRLLNFGHTFGHAFETMMLQHGTPVSHGEAVAFGMVCECFLSVKVFGLPDPVNTELCAWLLHAFGRHSLNEADCEEIVVLLRHDKKASGGKIRFTGLEKPGKGNIRGAVTAETAREALQHYQSAASR